MPRVDLDGVFERLRRDESEAWRELLEWLRHRMLRLLARRGVDEELAEDVVQESLAIVWQRWDSVREPSRFWSWVWPWSQVWWGVGWGGVGVPGPRALGGGTQAARKCCYQLFSSN